MRPDAFAVDDLDPHAARVARLRAVLKEMEGVLVAFSGGVDSSVLLHAATASLGARAVGVIADSPSLPRAELAAARRLSASIGARLEVVRTAELADDRYARNAGDRCYFCKDALFAAMEEVARRTGIRALAFGEITDDLADDRPGARAARERGVLAPLREAGFGKADVRRYAREHGLPVAEKPASACLASRIPVGTRVTRERLARVERAEAGLRALGVRGVLRVRDRYPLARVEVEDEDAARALWPRIEAALRSAGFQECELARYTAPGAR